jgi:di/tricarboxylate transporter
LILCIIGFILTGFAPYKSWFNVGVIGLVGATVLISTGCMPLKPTLRNLDWNTLIILAAAQGFAKGLDVSGGGKVIAEAVLNIFGGPAASTIALMVAGLVVSVVLTNFMSNTALAAMLTPIYIQIALQMGVSPVPFVIMIAASTNLATATPVGTPCVPQTLPAGYSYMDYVKVGGPLAVILMIAAAIIFPIVYPIGPLA